MNTEDRQHSEELLREHRRRLQQLELRAARYGINSPPELSTEIEDLKEAIHSIEIRLDGKSSTKVANKNGQQNNTIADRASYKRVWFIPLVITLVGVVVTIGATWLNNKEKEAALHPSAPSVIQPTASILATTQATTELAPTAVAIESSLITVLPLVPLPSVTAVPINSPTITAPTPTIEAVNIDGIWSGEYFNNPDRSGSPIVRRDDEKIDFNWGDGNPAPGVAKDNFSVRWTKCTTFEERNYTFYANAGGGVMRVLFDDQPLIQTLIGRSQVEQPLLVGAGEHCLVVEYSVAGDIAFASFRYK